MVSKQKLISQVKSPAKDAHIRKGKGFSLKEIKESGQNIKYLKTLKINIDYFRKSASPENIEKLKSLKKEEKKGKKRQPFVKKEKKKSEFRQKLPKVAEDTPKVIKKIPVKVKAVEKKKKVKKEKTKAVKIEKQEVVSAGTRLTELPGLGPSTAKKFIELGVKNVEDLLNENPEDLAPLLKGVSTERINKWIEAGKEILKIF